MFVPVSCTSCAKPFQVPETALGKLAPCPWCQTVVTALPVATSLPPPPPGQPAPASPEPPKPTQQEPLSLDDAEPIDKTAEEQRSPTPTTRSRKPKRKSEPKPKRLLVPIFGTLALVVVGTGATLLYLNYGSARLVDRGWSEFTPADGSFTVALPGQPAEEPVDANPAGSVTGGKRFSANGWYSKTAVWVAYNDLEPNLIPKIRADRDRVISAGVLKVEREREKVRLGGTITDEFPFVSTDAWGVELHMDTPRGKVVEWLILVSQGPHPRVYLYGAEAKDLTPQSPVCVRLRGSLQVNK
jgi:hypothetical protein